MFTTNLILDKPLMAKSSFFLPAGNATVAPPIGPVLGQFGVDMVGFCREFNEISRFILPNCELPVTVLVFNDRSFYFNVRKPTASFLLKSILYTIDSSNLNRNFVLKSLYKVSVLKGSQNTNKYFLCKMLLGTLSSLNLKIDFISFKLV